MTGHPQLDQQGVDVPRKTAPVRVEETPSPVVLYVGTGNELVFPYLRLPVRLFKVAAVLVATNRPRSPTERLTTSEGTLLGLHEPPFDLLVEEERGIALLLGIIRTGQVVIGEGFATLSDAGKTEKGDDWPSPQSSCLSQLRC